MRRPWRSAVTCALCAVYAATLTPRATTGAVSIHTNQVAYDARGPKLAVIESDTPFTGTETASFGCRRTLRPRYRRWLPA